MKCFVIMPFNMENANSIYENWIKPAVEGINTKNLNFICHRADKTQRPGEIISHILNNLFDSEIVIADLTGKNPNVFYELGVRHTLSNNTILISQNIEDIPFDLRTQRIITYQFTPDGMLNLKKHIETAIHSIIDSMEETDNPVREFLLKKEVQKFFSGSNLPSYNLVESLLSEITTLKKNFSEQFTQLSSVIENLVQQKSIVKNNISQPLDLTFFKGCWHWIETQSTFYGKVLNGQLVFPYCYRGNDALIAYFYDLRLIENILVGKFQWIHKKNTRGYIYLNVVDEDTLKGGWWYDEDISKQNINNYWLEQDNIMNMNKISMIRKKNINDCDFPKWVKDFMDTF